jgi:hypothetical protein
MNLLDMPYDVLALVVGKLEPNERLALTPVCKETRVLTSGTLMISRLARVIFSHPRIGLNCKFLPRMVFRHAVFFVDRTGPYDEKSVYQAVHIQCRGFEHSSRLKVQVGVKTSRRPADVQAVPKKWLQGGWDTDSVWMWFETAPNGDVSALKVTFRAGFAQRRAGLVGKVMGEVTKNVNDPKAQLLTQAFAGCENRAGGGVFKLGSDGELVSIDDQEESSDTHRVRVMTHPCDRAGNVHVDMCVL